MLQQWLVLFLILLSGGLSVTQPPLAFDALARLENQRTLAWHPDGNILAMGGILDGETGFWLYHLDSAEITRIPTEGNVTGAYWNVDGSKIAADVASGPANRYQIFNVENGQLIASFDQSATNVMSVIWINRDTQVITLEYNNALFRDALTGEIQKTLDLQVDWNVWNIEWDETRQRLYALSEKNTVSVWSPDSTSPIKVFSFNAFAQAMSLSPDGTHLAIGGRSGRIYILDAISGRLRTILQIKANTITRDLVWHSDNVHLASFSFDNVIRTWNIETGAQLDAIPVSDTIRALVWQPGTTFLTYALPDGAPYLSIATSVTVPFAAAGLSD
jgi:WD40 repeat protein